MRNILKFTFNVTHSNKVHYAFGFVLLRAGMHFEWLPFASVVISSPASSGTEQQTRAVVAMQDLGCV